MKLLLIVLIIVIAVAAFSLRRDPDPHGYFRMKYCFAVPKLGYDAEQLYYCIYEGKNVVDAPEGQAY